MSRTIQQAYASGGDAPLFIVQIKNESLPNGSLCYAYSNQDLTVISETGATLNAEGTRMAISLPERADKSYQTMQIQIDNVSGLAFGHMMAVRSGRKKVTVILRKYLPEDLSKPAENPIEMSATVASITPKSFALSCSFFDLLNKAWPKLRYTPKNTPGLKYST